jgi:three-Cys-motif partner protein
MTTLETSTFFREQRENAEIKSEVLIPFVEAWFGALHTNPKGSSEDSTLYLDLMIGQGSDDTASSAIPVRLLHTIYKTRGSRLDLNKSVETYFFDPDTTVLTMLKEELAAQPFYNELVHKPVVVDDENTIALLQERLANGAPALAFLNPFADSFTQGMLVKLAAQEADLFMLFEFDKLDKVIKSRKVDSLVLELLGEHLDLIKAYYKAQRDVAKRESFAIDHFESVFRDKGYRVFLFRVNLPDRKQSSHYLLFATKLDLAYNKLKERMLRYSDYQEDGVPLFGANLKQQQTLLFQEHYKYSIEGLMKDLLQKASLYNNMALQQVYEKHNIGTHYILENYKLAYERLLREGKVRFINSKTGQAISKLTATSKIRYSA